MPYISQHPELFQDKVVGDGNCVPFVRATSGAPQSSDWREGVKVRGTELAVGTAIATFVDGVYEGNATGNHAAIYISQDELGILVWDQWVGHPVSTRQIRFKGHGSASNDGDAFSTIL